MSKKLPGHNTTKKKTEDLKNKGHLLSGSASIVYRLFYLFSSELPNENVFELPNGFKKSSFDQHLFIPFEIKFSQKQNINFVNFFENII